MPNLPWLERTWTFDFPTAQYAPIVERLRGTPARLEELLSGVSVDTLTRHDGGGWSVLENAGHLWTLEELLAARVGDFLAGAPVLTAWNGTNADTQAAGHGQRDPDDVLAGFRAARADVVARLDALTPEDFARTSRHPRLDQEVRLVDLCFFHAEHDDHHLARVHELLAR